MTPNISPYQSAIRAAIQESGWEVASIEELDAWWCHECWRLRSIWAPNEASALLTFLIDPQSTTEQLQGEGYRVWAVKASGVCPAQWSDNEFEFSIELSGNWPGRLPQLVSFLNNFRKQCSVKNA